MSNADDILAQPKVLSADELKLLNNAVFDELLKKLQANGWQAKKGNLLGNPSVEVEKGGRKIAVMQDGFGRIGIYELTKGMKAVTPRSFSKLGYVGTPAVLKDDQGADGLTILAKGVVDSLPK